MAQPQTTNKINKLAETGEKAKDQIKNIASNAGNKIKSLFENNLLNK